jgi:hypothetical protein
MTPYAWSCLACDASNLPDSLRCSRCGCPAQATAAQVVAARDAWRQRSGLALPVPTDFMALVNEFPLLLIAAALLLLLGAVALIVGEGGSASAFGALLITLAAFCVSSYRKSPLR